MKYFILLFITLLLSGNAAAQQDVEEGKQIFKSRCASCHAVDRRLIGPALKDVDQRREKQWIIDFVQSSQTMVNNGDDEAVALFNQFNKMIMPDHKDLSDIQISNIIAYIIEQGSQTKTKTSGSSAYTPPYMEPYKDKNSIIDRIVYLNFDEEHTPIQKGDLVSWFMIAMIVLVLIAVLYIIVFFNTLMSLYSSKGSMRMQTKPESLDTKIDTDIATEKKATSLKEIV